MNEYDLTVCIPTYNNSLTIGRAIDSALNQGDTIEVVVVDDGSDDGTGFVCDEYSDKYDNVVVKHIDHSGVVRARNVAIDNSHGRFLTFLDADDWIDVNYCKAAIDIFNKSESINVDIVVLGMVSDDDQGNTKHITSMTNERIINSHEAVQELFNWNYYRWELCGKVYRRELFKNIIHDEGITVCEDLYANWYLFREARNVFFIPNPFYHYVMNPNSSTNSLKLFSNKSVKVFREITESDFCFDNKTIDVLYDRYMVCLRDDLRERSFLRDDSVNDNFSNVQRDRQYLLKLLSQTWKVSEKNEAIYREMKTYLNSDKVLWEWYVPWEQLIESIPPDINIWVYGSGLVATYFIELVSRMKRKVEGVVVTKKEKSNMGQYIVREYSSFNIKENDILVLAMNEKNQNEVLKESGENHIKRMYCLNCSGIF